MDKISFPFEIKTATETGHLTGLAAAFGNKDHQGDIIERGAFKASLEAHRAAGTAPAMLLHHDLARPIGRWESFEETPSGLLAKGKLSLGVREADETFSLLKDRALTGLSIGFSIPKGGSIYGRDGVRIIKQVDLHEVSLVSVPANPKARLVSVKSFEGQRAFERWLQDAGLSARDAKRVSQKGWAGLSQHDDEEAELVAMLLNAKSEISAIMKGIP